MKKVYLLLVPVKELTALAMPDLIIAKRKAEVPEPEETRPALSLSPTNLEEGRRRKEKRGRRREGYFVCLKEE